MITALLSFLGGGIGRMLFGEIVSFLNKRQEHAQEMERVRLQGELDAAQHARNMEAITTQASLGVKTIQVQAEAAVTELETQGWLEAVKGTTKTTGIAWIDGWNSMIRPAVATWSVIMMTLSEAGAFVLSENSIALCSASLGIYLASRDLFKRGK